MKKIRKDLKLTKNARDNLFKAHNRRGVHVRGAKQKRILYTKICTEFDLPPPWTKNVEKTEK